MTKKSTPTAVLVMKHLMGLLMFAVFGWLIYEFGETWSQTTVICALGGLLLFAVLIYAPSMFKPLLGAMKPLFEGLGKLFSQVGKDPVEKVEEKKSDKPEGQ